MAKQHNGSLVWAVARTSYAVFVLSGVLLAPSLSLAQQLPTGGTVTHGAAIVAAPQAGTLNINQTSNRAIIDWNAFSVGAGGRVNFNQPDASAATLNRVTGTASSTIAGAITAPGTVLLVNPNGIAITPTGTVNVGSFAASTLDIKNSDFLAGNYKFTGNGTSATVTNAGRINVSDGGFAALLGGRVANDGIITARLGRVGLGSGERITLDLAGDGFLSVEVPSNQLGNLVDGTGQALVSNRGKIRADGGIVHLSAATANAILRDAVNVPGSIRANSVGTRGGRIVLGGGAGGRVTVSGRLSASGTRTARNRTPGHGGQIDISGAEIALTGARLDASGATGGGRIRIGGDYQGSGDFPHAQSVSIDSASVIRADATQNGNGGTIVVWSDGLTSVSGTFSARGGATGGNGGLVETSGHELAFTGARVDTSAPHGRTGEWLLDPENLTVDSAAATTISNNLATANVTLLTTSTTASGAGVRTSGSGDIIINAPIYWTSGNMLRLNAYNSIYINSTIIGGTGSTLWLTTGGSGVVAQTAPISVTNLVLPLNFSSVTLSNTGNVVANLRTDDSSIDPNGDTFNGNPGSVSFTNNGNLTTGLIYARNLTLNVGGSLTATSLINGATNSSATVTSILASGNITFGTNGVLVGTDITVTAGGSIAFNSLTVGGAVSFRANGNISFEQNVTDYWGRPITSTSIRSDNGLVTFAVRNNQIRQIFTSGPVEIFYNPFAVYGTYANVSTYPGLTSGVGNGSVTAYMLVNDLNQLSSIETNLAGTYALGRDIDASGSVNMTCVQSTCAGFRPIGRNGGFTGLFDGRGYVISNLYQNWQTSLVGTQGVGLFSINRGTIRNVGILGGNLTGIGNSGGLVADNYGTISNSYSTATVRGIQDTNGNASVGGLVGLNRGTVNAGSYSTGTVRGIWAGGLVGENRGTINDSYAAGNVTGSYAGGLVGFNQSGAVIRWTYSLSSVNGSIYTGGLVGVNNWGGGFGSVIESYAAGRLSGSGIGGVVGENRFQDQDTMESFNAQYGMSARVWNSYWDVTATGTTRAFGRSYHDAPGGWTSEQIMNVASVGGNGPSAYTQDAYWYFRNPTLYDPHTGNTNGINWDQYGFNGHWYIIEGETRPFLRSEYSTNIQNLHQLQLINMNGAANYRIARDIDASAELASGMWNNNSFSPIRPVNWTDSLVRNYVEVLPGTGIYVQISQYYVPTATLSAFTGSLDGQGNTISNVYVNRWFPITNYYSSQVATGQNAGVFDTISSGGSVRNLGVVNSVFMASSGNAGSIAGTNSGTIERSWAERGSGTFGLNVTSDGIGGGLVGYNTGRISQSYSSVYVYGVGQSTQDWQFYAILGGLVGRNDGTIENAYATGQVLGNNLIGGLVGYNTGTIRNTYAATEIYRAYDGYGLTRAGRLVGQSTGTIVNSYYNSDIALWANYIETAGNGLTTAQMQDITTFASVYQGWDFQGIWIPPNQTGQAGQSTAHYPEFYWANYVAVVQTANATRTYGDANPQFLTSVYGLRSYDTSANVPVTVSTNATATSNVDSYSLNSSITLVPPTVTGCACGSTSGRTNWGLYINNIAIEFFNAATLSLQQIVDRFNAQTWRTGVTASIGSTGGIVLTSANAFQLAGMGVLWGNALDWLGLPTGTVNARQLQAVSSDGTAYRVITLSGTLSVTPRSLTITASDQSTTYGTGLTVQSGAFTATGLANGETVGSVTLVSSGGSATSNAGTYSITASNATGGTFNSGNYTISYVNGTLTVNRATLTITASSTSSVYGSGTTFTGTEFTSNGLLNGQSIGSVTLTSSGASTTSGAGTYSITASNATGGTFNPNNYTIGYVNGTLTVTRAALTITAGDRSSVYGDGTAFAGTEFTSNGLRNGETIGSVTLTSTGSPTTSRVGTYDISAGNATGGTFNANNYTIGYVDGRLTVTRAALTITANSTSSVYGDGTTFAGTEFTSNGLRNGEAIGTVSLTSAGSSSTASVGGGPYAIFAGNATGGTFDASNYTISYASGWLTITRAPLTVTASDLSNVYGNGTTFAGTEFTSNGLQNGETIGTVSLTSVGSSTTASVGSGPYAIVASNARGGTFDAGNYAITYANGWLTITRAPLTVTANDLSSVYGNGTTFAGTEFTSDGLQNGETIGTVSLTSAGAAPTATVVGGPYTITASNATGGTFDPGNYTISYVNGALTITPASITVTANGGTSIYGQSPTNPGLTASGLQNGETESVLTGLSNSFGIIRTTNAGRYTLRVDGALTNPNYTISTRNTGTWTVDPAAITVTANGGRSTYGQSPTNPGLSATGLQNGEGVGVLTGLTNAFGITNLTNAGNHTLRVDGTLTNGNYTIVARNSGVWTVDPAHITVTANGGRSVYGQSPTDPGFVAAGLQNGETVADLTGLANSFGINGQTNAGSHTLTITGALTNSNYVIDGRTSGVWTVDRAPLTVTANSQSRLFTERDPLLTYRITTGQLFNGDGLTGGLSRDTGDAPGFYAITQGSLATSSNYELTFVGGTLQIRALPADFPSQFTTSAPTSQGNTATMSFEQPAPAPVTFGSSSSGDDERTGSTPAPTTVANVTSIDPAVTGTVNANDRALTYLPISQFEAREYTGGNLPGYEDRTGEATVLTMIARALAGERANTLFIDNFWSTTANNNQGATEFGLIAQRVRFSNGQGRQVDALAAEPFPLQNSDPAALLQAGPLMIVAVGANGAQSWMLAIRLTEDGRGIVANDTGTGRQVILAYDPATKTIGGVRSVLDPKTNTFIAIGDVDALKAAGLEFAPERVSALQAYAPTGYLAVGVN